MNITAVLRECASDLLDTEPHVGVEQVVRCAYERHGSVFADAQEQMVLAAARRIVADIMRHYAENENEQQTFEGMRGLPSAIAVVTDDGTYYVRSDKATWHELMAGRRLRVDNVFRAQAALDAYDETCEVLRPVMEAFPDRSVSDALRRMT